MCQMISFKVGEHSFPCHKVILELNSDFFAAMFNSGMKESEVGEVRLDDGLDIDTVKLAINYMYTGKLDGTVVFLYYKFFIKKQFAKILFQYSDITQYSTFVLHLSLIPGEIECGSTSPS